MTCLALPHSRSAPLAFVHIGMWLRIYQLHEQAFDPWRIPHQRSQRKCLCLGCRLVRAHTLVFKTACLAGCVERRLKDDRTVLWRVEWTAMNLLQVLAAMRRNIWILKQPCHDIIHTNGQKQAGPVLLWGRPHCRHVQKVIRSSWTKYVFSVLQKAFLLRQRHRLDALLTEFTPELWAQKVFQNHFSIPRFETWKEPSQPWHIFKEQDSKCSQTICWWNNCNVQETFQSHAVKKIGIAHRSRLI